MTGDGEQGVGKQLAFAGFRVSILLLTKLGCNGAHLLDICSGLDFLQDKQECWGSIESSARIDM